MQKYGKDFGISYVSQKSLQFVVLITKEQLEFMVSLSLNIEILTI